jgi:hypothetical protein
VTRHSLAKLRKPNGRARDPVGVDLSDPRYAHLREQLRNRGELLTPEESEAALRWIETGRGRPPCV